MRFFLAGALLLIALRALAVHALSASVHDPAAAESRAAGWRR